MRFLFVSLCALMFLSPSAEAGKSAKRTPAKTVKVSGKKWKYAPRYSYLRALPKKDAAQVVRNVINFMANAEEAAKRKLEKNKFSLQQILFPQEAFAQITNGDGTTSFRDDDGGCVYDEERLNALPTARRTYFDGMPSNQCLMAGHLICLKLDGGRIRCTHDGSELTKISADAGCPQGQVACRRPPFLNKADLSKPLCTPVSGRSVTGSCMKKNETDGVPASEVADKIDELDLRLDWNRMILDIDTYCEHQMQSFDDQSCREIKALNAPISEKLGSDSVHVLRTRAGKFTCGGTLADSGEPKVSVKTYITAGTPAKVRLQVFSKRFRPVESGACKTITDAGNPNGYTIECDDLDLREPVLNLGDGKELVLDTDPSAQLGCDEVLDIHVTSSGTKNGNVCTVNGRAFDNQTYTATFDAEKVTFVSGGETQFTKKHADSGSWVGDVYYVSSLDDSGCSVKAERYQVIQRVSLANGATGETTGSR